MPGKRAINKKLISFPIERVLLARVEEYARNKGVNRIEAMKLMLETYLSRRIGFQPVTEAMRSEASAK